MILLTKTGAMFLAICVVLYFASLTSQSSLLLVIIGILLGCFLVNLFSARRAIKNLDVHAPPRIQIAEGERISQPWKITNQGSSATGFIQIQSGKHAVLRVATIAPGAVANVVPDLIFSERGVYNFAKMELSSVYPFGLMKSGRKLELAGEIVVHPAIYDTAPPRAAGYDVMIGGKFHGKRRVTSGTNFAGVRPMQPSDPLKQIHWKSSAKGQGLMVKTFEEELSGRISIIMDVGHSGDKTTLDDCVRATGSLIFSALDRGDHVEWIDLKQLDLLLIPPFADGSEILERLARIQNEPGCLNAERVQKAIQRISRKSAICFVLTDFNDAAQQAIAELQRRNRIVSIYVSEKCVVAGTGATVWRYSSDSIGPCHREKSLSSKTQSEPPYLGCYNSKK